MEDKIFLTFSNKLTNRLILLEKVFSTTVKSITPLLTDQQNNPSNSYELGGKLGKPRH